MTVSIVIAVKNWQKNLEECLTACQALDFSDFQILILPDIPLPRHLSDPRVKVIPTGAVSPAKKRDIALGYARGEILAFIDDDTYPPKDWLKYAVENFKDENIAAVGGPAITPESDSTRQRASGIVYSSFLVSGKFAYRYVPKKKNEVDDYPSCNLLVRKSIMEQLGGFKTNFWPGEDTKLCLDITKKLGKKIIYDPKVLIYHHRRPLFLPHLRQIASYALHRGYFVKRFPETSLRISYFLPTLFLFGLIVGLILSLALPFIKVIYLLSLILYFLSVCISSMNKEPRLAPFVFLGIIMTHLTYGLFFIKGLLVKKLKEENENYNLLSAVRYG